MAFHIASIATKLIGVCSTIIFDKESEIALLDYEIPYDVFFVFLLLMNNSGSMITISAYIFGI